MKSIPITLLFGAACHASFFDRLAPPTSSISDILGLLGLKSIKLANLDIAKYASFIKPFIPAANAFADSGMLVTYAHSIMPTLPLVDTTTLQPKLRSTAKRTKVRLGPFTLTGKGASILLSYLTGLQLTKNSNQDLQAKAYPFHCLMTARVSCT
jgi:hypothetical protein